MEQVLAETVMKRVGLKKNFPCWAIIMIILHFFACTSGTADRTGDLIGMLKSSDAKVRRDAALSLGYINESRVHEVLIGAMSDPAPWVRQEAGSALGKLKSRQALAVLMSALKDCSPEVRSAAANALGDIGDRVALDPLLVATSDPEPLVRTNAIGALGNLGDPRALDVLLKLLEEEPVNDMVYFALGKIGDPRAIAPLIAKVKQDQNGGNAVSGLKEIGPTAFTAMVAELNNDDEKIRGLMIRGLLLCGPPVIHFLIDLVKNGSTADRKKAGLVLQWVEEWYAGDPLKEEVDQLLDAAMRERNLPLVAGASSYFIRKGEIDTEVTLVQALKLYGDEVMANEYLNCTNGKLIGAAYRWARQHGLTTTWTMGKTGAMWGRDMRDGL
jgi:hypothetical protein